MRNKTLIIGSSPFALGYALKHKGTKIFEKSNLVDPVFAGTLFTSEVERTPSKNEYIRLFKDDKSIKENKIEILRSEVLLSKFILENKIFLRFTTFIIEIVKKDNKYQVKYCDNEGLHTEIFTKIIKVIEPVENNNISAMVLLKEKIDLPKVKDIKLSIKESFNNDTYFINFKLNENLSPNDAKAKILPIIENMISGENKLLISAHHTYSDNVFAPYVDENGILNVCDRFFGNPSTAFSMGKKENF